MTAAKLQLQPPALARAKCYWLLKDEIPFTTAGQLVGEVGSAFRYRRAIRKQVETDLLRFFSLEGRPVLVGIADGRPFFYFNKVTVDRWLDAGGRTWILAELEARSGQRVIAFPGRRS